MIDQSTITGEKKMCEIFKKYIFIKIKIILFK